MREIELVGNSVIKKKVYGWIFKLILKYLFVIQVAVRLSA